MRIKLRTKALLLILILLASVFVWLGGKEKLLHAEGNSALPLTNIHRHLVQEDEWINLTRPLLAEDMRGRIILLDFWTFCCINCMHIVPDLQYLEHTFGDNLTVIGVHSAKFLNEKDKENIRSAVLRYGIEHPVVNDADFKIWNSFGVSAWPTLILINPLGKIESIYSGEGHRDEIASDIAALIEDYKGRINVSNLPIALEKDKQPERVLNFPGKIEFAKKVAAFNYKDTLFVSDSSNNRILAVAADNGEVFKIYGSKKSGFIDEVAEKAAFNKPQGMTIDNNILYVADTGNHAIRAIDLNTSVVSTVVGTGKQGNNRRVSNVDARETELSSPWDVEFFPDKEHLVIAMAGAHQLWIYDLKSKKIGVLAGNGRESIDDGQYPINSLSQPSGLAAAGDRLYFVDSETSSLRVFEDDGISTLIGSGLFDFGFKDGAKGEALLQHPLGVFADAEGVYIADSYNHVIRKFNPITGNLTTLYGDGKRDNKKDKTLRFDEPNDIIRANGKFYIADTNNHTIRVIDDKTGKAEMFTINLKATKPAKTVTQEALSETKAILPNLKKSEVPQVVSGKNITLDIKVAEGWKINPEAPSYLILSQKNKVVKQWDYATLKNLSFKIPALEKDKTYRLYGTLYHCENKKDAICRVQSYDQSFTPDAKGTSSISITLETKD